MFLSYPEFSKLELSDKQAYEKLANNYPPVSDLAFATLMIWWNFNSNSEISIIRSNFVLFYSSKAENSESGFCLIGTDEVDKSLDDIFQSLIIWNKPVRLVHVPDFVIQSIHKPEQYNVTEERDFAEYLYSTEDLSSLQSPSLSKIRRKVNRFVREAGESNISINSLDLSIKENQDSLLKKIDLWRRLSEVHNDEKGEEVKAIVTSIVQSELLEIRNLCIYINGEMHGVALYHESHDSQYIIAHHIKVSPTFPHTFDFVIKQLAILAKDSKIPYLNLEMDLGIEGLRDFKLRLRPIGFFKKYCITPR